MHHEARGNEPHLYAVFWRRDQPIATRRSTRPAAVDASSLPPSVLYLRIQSAPVPRRRVADSPNATATPTPPAAGLTGRCHATLRGRVRASQVERTLTEKSSWDLGHAGQ